MSGKQHEAEHIIVQLRKVVNTHGHSNVRFAKENNQSVTIDEAQSVMAIYSDALPCEKELIQQHVSASYQNLKDVAELRWTPVIESDRIVERPLFNTDEIFGYDQEPAKVFRPIIKKQRRRMQT